MAKINPIFGKIQGKLGGNVFAISNGQVVIREYNPAPANPKSNAQMLQRAKGNLVGRISSIVPKAVITGLGSNGRERRSRFLKIALDNAVAQLVDGQFVARLNPANLVFSEGAGIPPAKVDSMTLGGDGTAVTLTMSRIAQVSQDLWDRSDMIGVIVAVDDENGNYDLVAFEDIALPAYPAISATFQAIVHVPPVSNHTLFVFTIAMNHDTKAAAVKSRDIATDTSNNIQAAMLLTASAATAEFAHSKYEGIATATQKERVKKN